MAMLLSALIAASALIAYIMVEKRINRRACPECGFTVSVDAIEEQCPNCGATASDIRNSRAGGGADEIY
jgi:Zn finger protein HypA/HybF involved in hydrogenase expression